MSPQLPPQAANLLRKVLRRARAVVNHAPAPLSERVRAVARTTRNRRRDQRRAELGDDGAYFDAVVDDAIAQSRSAQARS